MAMDLRPRRSRTSTRRPAQACAGAAPRAGTNVPPTHSRQRPCANRHRVRTLSLAIPAPGEEPVRVPAAGPEPPAPAEGTKSVVTAPRRFPDVSVKYMRESGPSPIPPGLLFALGIAYSVIEPSIATRPTWLA